MFEKQRQNCSFNKVLMGDLLHGGRQIKQNYFKLQALVANDPILRFDPSNLHQSRKEMMLAHAKKFMRYHQYIPFDGFTQMEKNRLFLYSMPLSLHAIMFLTTLSNLSDKQQRKLFLQPALRGEIIGCYAQTQLAHGSDVAGLMTTATYDPSNQTFLINTPQVEAAKWWAGDLGIYANHAAVFAQLIIDGKKYGVHVFIVPVRDRNTLLPLKGVEIGDIGPKNGFQCKDNGYAIFSNIRIPRRNMLMKYHVVSKEGKYSIEGDQKISYATMLLTRSKLTMLGLYTITRGITIATRYSIVRTQFKDSKGRQIPILDYQTQQEKVLPRIAEAYASSFSQQNITKLSNFVFQQGKKGRFEMLNEAHVLTSAVKGIQSYQILRGLEILRRSCGGHGFNSYNGIIGLQQEYGTVFTLQGQFTVLMLQVGRFLLKSLKNLIKGKPLAQSIAYLQLLKEGQLSVQIKDQNSLNCPFFIQKILSLHSCANMRDVGTKFQDSLFEKLSQKEIWDHHAGILLNDAAMTHSSIVMYNYFLKQVQKVNDPPTKAILNDLLTLYGIQKIIDRAGKFYQMQTLSPEGVQLIFKQREILFSRIRPQALNLVESFGYDDNVLNSAIGASHGKPYETLIDWARNSNTLNRPKERGEIIEAIKQAKQQIRAKL